MTSVWRSPPRSGIIAAYRTENTPEATSALDNIEELLNSMQLFKEQRDAEIRSGERQRGRGRRPSTSGCRMSC